jgi:cytochrome c553
LFQKVSLAGLFLASVLIVTAQAPSEAGKPLPPGPMQAKIKAACTQCHNTERITEQHLSREEWSQKLEKMEGLGAVIPDTDRNGMLNYLAKNFGPQKGAKIAPKKNGTDAN